MRGQPSREPREPVARGTVVCVETGKFRLHKGAAKSEAKRNQGGALNAYRCTFCGGWHVGHLPRWKR